MAHICCGYIQNGGYLRSTNASYAATRSGSSLTLNTAATRIGQAVASGNYYAYEYFCSIDTSEMPEEAIVRSVRLFLYGSADSSDDDFTGEARAYDWGESVTTDDWVPGANLGDCALIASWSSASYSAAYNPFDGDDASINAGGVTKMVLASAKLRTGTAPTKYEFVDFTVPTSGTNLGMFIVLYDMPEPEQKPWFDVALEMTDIGRNCLSSEEVWGSTMLPLDPSDYDGSPQFYLELIANSDAASSGSIPRRMTLRDVTNGVDVASVVVPPSDLAGDNGRVLRSAPFTPNEGNNIYALKNEAGAVSGSWRAPSVRIIVRQTKPTKTRIQFPLTSGVDVASTDGGYVWQCSASYAQDSATRAVLWRKDSAALRSLASGTPWTLEAVFYSGWDDLVGHLVLRNLSSGNNVAASEVSAEAGVAGGSFILSQDFADDAAEFSDGALFGVFTKYSVRTDLRLQRAALYARLDGLKALELWYRCRRALTEATIGSTMAEARTRLYLAGLPGGYSLYHEATGLCADDGERAFLRAGGTDHGAINWNSATRTRKRVSVGGLSDGDEVVARTANSTSAQAIAAQFVVAAFTVGVDPRLYLDGGVMDEPDMDMF